MHFGPLLPFVRIFCQVCNYFGIKAAVNTKITTAVWWLVPSWTKEFLRCWSQDIFQKCSNIWKKQVFLCQWLHFLGSLPYLSMPFQWRWRDFCFFADSQRKVVIRIWDCFFYESHKLIFFQVGLALLKLAEEEILAQKDAGFLILKLKQIHEVQPASLLAVRSFNVVLQIILLKDGFWSIWEYQDSNNHWTSTVFSLSGTYVWNMILSDQKRLWKNRLQQEEQGVIPYPKSFLEL